MIRLKDIAEHVGVSISTVSRVVQNDSTRNVHPETKRKIWEAVKELGYIPNQHARNLVTKNHEKKHTRTLTIGWIVNRTLSESHPYFSSVFPGITDTLAKANYTLINIHKEELQNETMLLKIVHELGMEGLILIDEIDDNILEYITQYLPVVGVDFYCTNKNISSIDYDREAAVKMAVQHLKQQGHQKIGFIGGGVGDNYENLHDEKRYKGFQYAMGEAGLEIHSEWIVNTRWEMKESYERMNRLIKEHRDHLPTAIFCASDMMAIAAMRAVLENKLRVPEDIAFIGVDNIEMAKYTTPPLTTIDIPKYEIGAMAAKTVMDKVEKKIKLPVKIILPHELIIRESS
ncbi:LacI family DNA-binding transcriptional regulator [Bacillus manliponensis]|uniref:LacI family DNA-binding transcriptional regulator n=1 Tax=Bacillus manliponensis TaxID=574376 RepID=UPI003513C9E9